MLIFYFLVYFKGTIIGDQTNFTLTSDFSGDSGYHTCLTVNSAGYSSLSAQVSLVLSGKK